MLSLFALELHAEEVMRARRLEADQRALIAQLPPARMPRPDLAARVRAANALRALAIRLDPCGGSLRQAAWRRRSGRRRDCGDHLWTAPPAPC